MSKKIDLPQNLKQQFLELGTKIVRDEYFRRINNMIETRRNLEELPELVEYLDYKFPDPPADFEERLAEFARKAKDV